MRRAFHGRSDAVCSARLTEVRSPFRARHHAASRLPSSVWITLQNTDGTADIGSSGKFFFASTAARPPFCMPTSIETVRLTFTEKRSSRAIT